MDKISTEELSKKIQKIVSNNIELNKDMFDDNADKNKHSLLIQIAVMSTLEILKELGYIPTPQD